MMPSVPWNLSGHGHAANFLSIMILRIFSSRQRLPIAALWIGLVASGNKAWSQGHSPTRGVITFDARDAQLVGTQILCETNSDQTAVVLLPGDPSEKAVWRLRLGKDLYRTRRWGRYTIDIDAEATTTQKELPELEFRVTDSQKRDLFVIRSPLTGGKAPSAESFYLSISDPDQFEVHQVAGRNPNAVRLKKIRWVPAAEGDIPPVSEDGTINLPSGSATTHSEMMRYEPATNKNCLGYWVDPLDWAEWSFQVPKPGTYEIELWQGCGGGQGGSEVAVSVGGERFSFVVEETGHFQNFVPRRIGRIQFSRPGKQTFEIVPQNKKAAAVMDVRRVRLIPVVTEKEPAPGARAFVSARRVVVLGDSITYNGKWLDFVETWLRLEFPDAPVEILNLGLPSETASGLSEPGHAGGAFPRPDVHERLERVIARTRPDLILACYGMNDGIYFPQNDERMKKYQEGIQRLHERAAHEGIRVIHLTPPVFDPKPLAGKTLPAGRDAYPSPYEGYDDVLGQYATWLISKREQGWQVIDLHGAIRRFLDEQRSQNPDFLLAGDGVHPNEQGHWLMAREVLREFGADTALLSAVQPQTLLQLRTNAVEVHRLVQQRQQVLKDSWLTAVGHLRPGMNPGKPLEDAQVEAKTIAERLRSIHR